MCMRADANRPLIRRHPPAFAHAFVERASLARPTLSIERKLRRTGCPREWYSDGFALGISLRCPVGIVTRGRESDTGKQIKTLALRYSDTMLSPVRGRGRRRVRERRASIATPDS
jgi:hypothetical protein